jgi:hypothetical protein
MISFFLDESPDNCSKNLILLSIFIWYLPFAWNIFHLSKFKGSKAFPNSSHWWNNKWN